MAEITRLSKVNINYTEDGEEKILTNVPIATDIDNLFVYETIVEDDGTLITEKTVKELLFGEQSAASFVNNSMYDQLKTVADDCQTILKNNETFWQGLSEEIIADEREEEYGYEYTCSPEDDIANIDFYNQEEHPYNKVVTYKALSDFAKRIPAMGNPENTAEENAVAFGANAKAAANSFAFNGTTAGESAVAFNGTAEGEKSIAFNGTAEGEKSIAFNGTAEGEESIAIGAGTQATKPRSVQIGSFPVIDNDADFILGNGSESDRKSLMMIKDGILFLPWSDAQGDDLKLYTLGEDITLVQNDSENAIFESIVWFDRLPYSYVKYVFETVSPYWNSTERNITFKAEINISPRTIPEVEFEKNFGTHKNNDDYDAEIVFKWSLTKITGLEQEGYLLRILPNMEGYGDTTAERFYTKWKLISKQVLDIQPF